MKNLKFGFFGMALMLSVFAGCADPCKDIVCENGGTCSEGDCICTTGYEGDLCATAMNAKFAGSYSLNETCDHSGTPANPYSVTVAAKSTPLDITFVGLWEVTQNIVNSAVGTDGVTFSIEKQAIDNTFEIQATNGSITADGNTINLTYTVSRTSVDTIVDVCTAVLTK